MRKIKISILIIIFMMVNIINFSTVFAATYKYDEINRLVEVIYDSGQRIQYTYDAAGNILTIRKVEADIELLEITTQLENMQNVSYERPVIVKAIANREVTWEVVIKNPQGNTVATLDHIGLELDKIWSPSQYTINNGEYTVTIKAQADNQQVEQVETFNVYNYPVKNNDVLVIIQGKQRNIRASIENLGPNVKSPMLIVQVKDLAGYVVFIGTAQMEGLQTGQSINLSTGTVFNTGEYIAEVFVWDGWDSKNPLSEKLVEGFVVE